MIVAEKKQVLAGYKARHPDRPGTNVLGQYHDSRSESPYFVVLSENGSATAYYPDGNPNQDVDDQVAAIGRRVLRRDALLPRGRDALDFHSLGVVGVRDALQEAYEAGCADGADGATEEIRSPAPPREESAVLDAAVAEEAEKALWHRKRNGRYDPVGLDHDRLIELLNRVAERAFMAGRAVSPGEVVVTVEGGWGRMSRGCRWAGRGGWRTGMWRGNGVRMVRHAATGQGEQIALDQLTQPKHALKPQPGTCP